jgi:hypothetical protein
VTTAACLCLPRWLPLSRVFGFVLCVRVCITRYQCVSRPHVCCIVCVPVSYRPCCLCVLFFCCLYFVACFIKAVSIFLVGRFVSVDEEGVWYSLVYPVTMVTPLVVHNGPCLLYDLGVG